GEGVGEEALAVADDPGVDEHVDRLVVDAGHDATSVGSARMAGRSILSALAMAMTSSSEQLRRPFSMLERWLRSVPTARASAVWVRPLRSRMVRSAAPLTITVWIVPHLATRCNVLRDVVRAWQESRSHQALYVPAQPCHARPCLAKPCRARPCQATPWLPRHAEPCHAEPCRACPWLPRRAVPCRAQPSHAGPSRAAPRRGCRATPGLATPCRAAPGRALPGPALPALARRRWSCGGGCARQAPPTSREAPGTSAAE